MPAQQPQQPRQQNVPPWGHEDQNRIDINLIAMLLWQSLLTGVAVAVSHMNWYLPDAGPGEMGLQYGLVAFGFLCLAMVLFHVGGIRDSLSMRAEFSQEARYDKWLRAQQRLQDRRMRKHQFQQQQQQQHQQHPYQQPQQGGNGQQTFGLPNTPAQQPPEVNEGGNSNNHEEPPQP